MLREIKKIIVRKEFVFVFLVLFFSVIGEFLYGCHMFEDIKLSGVISAYDGTILSNNFNSPFGVCYGLLMPICVSIIASTLAYEEKKQGITACIYTRESKKTYILKQAAAVYIAAFFIVLFCLLISFILSAVTFPLQGYNTMFQADYARLLNIDNEYMLDSIYRLHPYINLFIFIFLRALFAGAFAFMAYGCSFIGKWMKKITIILVPFVFIVCMQLLFQIGKTMISQQTVKLFFSTNILAMNQYGKLEMFAIIWLTIMLLGSLGLKKGMYKGDIL